MRSLTSAIPGALALLLRDTPLSDGKVVFAWKAAVGPAFERATAVKLEGTVLIVEVGSVQWARELKRSTGVILTRLQTLLGDDAVTAIKVRHA
jgi:predicted nucleic acid-binding Zn ribbon protein